MKKSSLPPGLRVRKSTAGKTFYYLKTSSPQEVPLGRDRDKALHNWRAYQLGLYHQNQSIMSPVSLLQCFRTCEIPLRQDVARPALIRQVTALERYFVDCDYVDLTGLPDASRYLAHRGTHHSLRAGAEIRLFIHIWTWGHKHSLIDRPDCPWKSDDVRALMDQIRGRELGDALRFYGSNREIPQRAGGQSDQYDSTQNRTGGPADGQDVASLISYAARRLVRDGRPDLARALTQLTIDQTPLVLEAIQHPRDSCPTELILGTDRREKLRALKSKLAREKKSLQDD
ncbi:hypothetical protein P3T16_006360 [Paraburkholderia sp. GAS42]